MHNISSFFSLASITIFLIAHIFLSLQSQEFILKKHFDKKFVVKLKTDSLLTRHCVHVCGKEQTLTKQVLLKLYLPCYNGMFLCYWEQMWKLFILLSCLQLCQNLWKPEEWHTTSPHPGFCWTCAALALSLPVNVLSLDTVATAVSGGSSWELGENWPGAISSLDTTCKQFSLCCALGPLSFSEETCLFFWNNVVIWIIFKT